MRCVGTWLLNYFTDGLRCRLSAGCSHTCQEEGRNPQNPPEQRLWCPEKRAMRAQMCKIVHCFHGINVHFCAVLCASICANDAHHYAVKSIRRPLTTLSTPVNHSICPITNGIKLHRDACDVADLEYSRHWSFPLSIVEIAKSIGISHSTVSRVINKRPGVAPETVEAVYRAMDEMGYRPAARRRGRRPNGRQGVATGNIAVLMVGTDGTLAKAPITATVFHALEHALADQGFNVLVGQLGNDGRLPPDVSRGRVDGLLLHGYPPTAEVRERLRRHPSVWVLSQRAPEGYWGDRVTPDNGAIGRRAAEYLIGEGHERVGYLHAGTTHLGYRDRAESFCVTATSLGAHVELASDREFHELGLAAEPQDVEVPSVEELVERLLAARPRITAIFVPRDQLAVKVYLALRRNGLEPGRDIAVVSCDNDRILDALDPRPVTFDVRADLIGRRAVDQLIWRMNNAHEPTRVTVTVEPELMVPERDVVRSPVLEHGTRTRERGRPSEGRR
ncbi:MAG: LacI family DNA-binding transcriptional regulator [Planctomycetota bacterium]